MKQEIEDRLNGMCLDMEYAFSLDENVINPKSMANMTRWIVSLERKTYTQLGRKVDVLEIPFYTGDKNKHPHIADVMHALMADRGTILYADTFEEWAEGLGYDSDSREAERTFKQCKLQTEELSRLFNDDELVDIAEMLENY
jgi:hypothetical protein